MDYLIIISVFFLIMMLAFMATIVYLVRTFLGITSKPLIDAENAYNPIPNQPSGDVETYLNNLGGNRFTDGPTFDMNRAAAPETPLPEEVPSDLAATDPSEIAIT